MSELINNREYRQKILKELILELHDGKSVEDVRERFQELIKGVSTAEISQMEAQLIKEGMKVEEIQRLCDVHAAVFKGSIEEIHHPDQSPGHPIHTFKRENKAVQDLIDNQFRPNIDKYKNNEDIKFDLLDNINLLGDLDKHYSRKENLLFPYLEKYGITAPPQVMWGVDDEIREEIKACKKAVSEEKEARSKIAEMLEKLIVRIEEMIYKEEHILSLCAWILLQKMNINYRRESAE